MATAEHSTNENTHRSRRLTRLRVVDSKKFATEITDIRTRCAYPSGDTITIVNAIAECR
jgi:hypothetical protein